MSTLPRDPSHADDAMQPMPLMLAARYEQEVDAAVREFEAVAVELGIARPSAAELRDLCRQVAALSDELFSSEIMIAVRGDPEIPGELHFTFYVSVTGDVDDIVALINEWHIKLRQAIGRQAELFCLSFDVR